MESIIFKRNASPLGGSISVVIPPELLEFLEIKEGMELHIAADKSKHGRFIAIWNPEQQKKGKKE